MTTLDEAAGHWREWFGRGEFDEGAARVRAALEAPGAESPPSSACASSTQRSVSRFAGASRPVAVRMFAERDARSGIDAYGDAWRDLNSAALALAHGDREQALQLFGSGKKKLAELGGALDPDDQFELDWLTRGLAV